ncbi:MAG: sigma-54-dependent Fis family transcriptional regulator [Myxococcales bacterium]|nr:sigma-54-dependent Fis family transcriptional regulator [Myxococcales bacterium]
MSPTDTDSAERRILIVDDDPLALRLVGRLLRPLGFPVLTAGSGEEALEIMEQTPIGLLLTDLRMDGIGGDELLEIARRRYPTLPVLIMTTHGSVDTAVSLMRKGATDFLTKPVDGAVLQQSIERVLRRAELEGEVATLRRALARQSGDKLLVGEAPVFRKMLDRLPLAARSDVPILVLGETGTGKELVARTLHDQSSRAEQPFIAVNCGALPGELLDSELFGHVKGAFTDARRDKTGLVADADGGTLFLDEIGDMPLALQVKLLRFLQEGEIRPVGSNKTRKVDVRIVAATHRDLRMMVDAGDFREDLYYRLNVIPIHVPPLRDRGGDVALIAQHLLTRFAATTTRPGMHFSKAAIGRLSAHGWAGNVRELENVVRRAAVFGAIGDGDEIGPDVIEFDGAQTPVRADRPAIGQTLEVDLEVPLRDAKDALVDAFQEAYCRAALAEAEGVVAAAARRAGKDRKSFWELLQRYEIDPDSYRDNR